LGKRETLGAKVGKDREESARARLKHWKEIGHVKEGCGVTSSKRVEGGVLIEKRQVRTTWI